MNIIICVVFYFLSMVIYPFSTGNNEKIESPKSISLDSQTKREKGMNEASKSISLDDLAKNTKNLINQKNRNDYEVKTCDSRINSLKNEKTSKESYYNKQIDREKEKRNKMKKDEFETTASFKKRQTEQDTVISKLMKERDQVINDYNKKTSDKEAKKNNLLSSVTCNSFTGDFIVSEITLVYNVSSIQYNADTGIFDIILSLDDNDLLYKISSDLTISCKSPDSRITYQKRVPNISEARRFKNEFKKAIISITNVHVKRYYQNICLKEGYYREERDRADQAEDIAIFGLSLLAGLVFDVYPDSSYYEDSYREPKTKRIYVEPVYEKRLIFEVDSYTKYNNSKIVEIVGNNNLIKQKSNSLLSRFPQMIKNK